MLVTIEEFIKPQSVQEQNKSSLEGIVREKDYIVRRIGQKAYESVLAHSRGRVDAGFSRSEERDIGVLPEEAGQ